MTSKSINRAIREFQIKNRHVFNKKLDQREKMKKSRPKMDDYKLKNFTF